MASCYDRYTGRHYNCRSAWSDWVRWVVLGVVVVGGFLLFFLFSFITARRRRKAGRQPFYGTGWVPGTNAQPHYNNNYQHPQHPPPQYSAQPQNSYYGANQGYYNNTPYGQVNGVEMQPPQPTYARGQDEYSPPPGPPPGKGGDGIIR